MTSLEQTSTPGSVVHFTIRWQKQEEFGKKQNKIVFEAKPFEFVYVGRAFTLAEVLITDAAASATGHCQWSILGLTRLGRRPKQSPKLHSLSSVIFQSHSFRQCLIETKIYRTWKVIEQLCINKSIFSLWNSVSYYLAADWKKIDLRDFGEYNWKCNIWEK